MTRFLLAALIALFLFLKFLFHINHFSDLGLGFWGALILTGGLVYFAMQGRGVQASIRARRVRANRRANWHSWPRAGSTGGAPAVASHRPPPSRVTGPRHRESPSLRQRLRQSSRRHPPGLPCPDPGPHRRRLWTSYPSRLRRGELIAGAAGVLLLASMFLLPWYGLKARARLRPPPRSGVHDLVRRLGRALAPALAAAADGRAVALAMAFFQAARSRARDPGQLERDRDRARLC